jgi:hypothetical protein
MVAAATTPLTIDDLKSAGESAKYRLPRRQVPGVGDLVQVRPIARAPRAVEVLDDPRGHLGERRSGRAPGGGGGHLM